MDGQVVKETDDDDGYHDFTCPDVVSVEAGGSFDVSVEFRFDGSINCYATLYVDWGQDRDWESYQETAIIDGATDDSETYSATVDVPDDAPSGNTLARLRLDYASQRVPGYSGYTGEVQDYTIHVE